MEYRLNRDKFQQWVLNARQDVNAFFQRYDYAFALSVKRIKDLIGILCCDDFCAL
jgi:hypothetical protein